MEKGSNFVSVVTECKLEVNEEEESMTRDRKPKSETHCGILVFAVKSDLWLVAAASIFMIASALTRPLQTYIIGEVVQHLNDYKASKNSEYPSFMSRVKLLCFFIILAGIGNMIASWIGIFLWMKLGERQAKRARYRLFHLSLDKTTAWIDTRDNIMGNLSQANRCIEELRAGSSEVIGLLIQTIASIIGLLITSLIKSWSVTLVTMAGAPLMVVLGIVFSRRTMRSAETENELSAQAAKILNWTFLNNATVKMLNGKYLEILRFKKLADMSAEAYYRLANSIASSIGLMRCISLLMFVQALWFGNTQVIKGKLEVGQVVTCFGSCLVLVIQASEISILLTTLQRALVASSRLARLLNEENILNSNIGLYPKEFKGCISFQNVLFQYPAASTIQLNYMNICFEENQLHFVVGKSGSGKSTIAQIIAALYQCSSGSVKIDGYSISTLNTKWITDNITLIQQSLPIFSANIQDNIGIAVIDKFESLNDVPDLLVDDALQFALLDDFIDTLPFGKHSEVRPQSLSGGQKQRIGLARAKIRDTPLLILDEALSALDHENVSKLYDKIRKWRVGKTTIIITHNLHYIYEDDMVHLIHNGTELKRGLKREFDDHELLLHSEHNQKDSKEDNDTARSTLKMDSEDYLHNPVILRKLEKSGNSFKTEETRKEHIFLIYEILKGSRSFLKIDLFFTIGLLASILGALCSPLFAFSVSKLLNAMSVGEQINNFQHFVITWACILLGTAVVDGISHYLSHFFLSYASERWILSLRKVIFEKLNDQSCFFFENDEHSTAELTALIMNDTRDLRNIVSEFIPTILKLLIILSAGIIWAIQSGWKLALVGLSFIPLVLFINYMYCVLLTNSETHYKNKVAILENINHEAINEIKSIRILNLRKAFDDIYFEKLQDIDAAGFSRALHTGFGVSLSSLISSIATGICFLYGMELVGSNEYSYNKFWKVLSLLTLSLGNSASLMTQLPDITRGKRAGTFLLSLLELKASKSEIEGYVRPIHFPSEVIWFDDLTFSYTNSSASGHMALKKVTFSIKKNKITSIIGKSGSGKSTITSLLMRLYDVPDGKLFICGYDINSIDIDWLRDNIAIVDQHPKFFEGSIHDNLVYGVPKSKMNSAVIEKYLRMVNMYTFIISLPDGVNTRIGEGERSLLSSGQIQRLAIARALIREPKILILDECTSNLDNLNNQLIRGLIKNIVNQKNITVVMISHDLDIDTISHHVIKLKEGLVTNN